MLFMGCFVGCMWQISSISKIYFKYETSTELKLSIPGELPAPDLSVCFRYSDIFNVSRFNVNRTGDKLSESQNEDAIKQIQSVVTIADIFEYTPPTDLVIVKCRVRLPDEYRYREFNVSQCRESFKIYNFYVQVSAWSRFSMF